MIDEQRKPDTATTAKPHVKPWSRIARRVSLGENRRTLPWVEAVSRTLESDVAAVLAVIATRTGFKDWSGFRWSIRHLCKWVGYGRTVVVAALKLLREYKYVMVDGEIDTDYPRGIVVYRLGGTPEFPLPRDVIDVRDPDLVWTESGTQPVEDQKSLTCENDYKTQPKGPRGSVCKNSHVGFISPLQACRSVEDEPSPNATRASAERHTIPPYLHTIPDVASRLKPRQLRKLADAADHVMRVQGITPERLAARIRHWWSLTVRSGQRIRSAVGWLWHAIESRPYGCADPRCEDGDVWDGARVVGCCQGCVERRRDRAAAKRSGNAVTAPWTRSWTPLWVSERAEARAALTAFVAGSG